MAFLKKNAGPLTFLMALLDSICALGAYAAAVWFIVEEPTREAYRTQFIDHIAYLVVFVVVWSLLATDQRLFASRRDASLGELTASVLKTALIAVSFSVLLVAFLQRGTFEQRFIVYFGVGTVTAVVGFRAILRMVLLTIRRRGYNFRQVVIIGANERAKHFAEVIRDHEEYGYVLIGVIDDDPERMALFEPVAVEYLGATKDLERYLQETVVDEVYISLPVRSHYETITSIAHLCESVGVVVRLVADFFPVRIARRRIDLIEDVPVLSLSAIPEQQVQLAMKRMVDILASGLGLLVLLPTLFLPLAILIKLDSPGPLFFGQERVGMNQRRFKMLKFRSMVVNAEALKKELEAANEADGPVFKMKNDPRITRIGRFIRKYSLDEFPQLINVFRGDMSLVGPRPPIPSEVEEYSWDQRRRLSVRPGMTGLWQVTGRSDTQFDEWVALDLEYIDNWSIELDIKILLRTFGAVVRGRGAA